MAKDGYKVFFSAIPSLKFSLYFSLPMGKTFSCQVSSPEDEENQRMNNSLLYHELLLSAILPEKLPKNNDKKEAGLAENGNLRYGNKNKTDFIQRV